MIEINYKDVLETDVSFLLKYYDNIGHITGSDLLDCGGNSIKIIK